MSAALAPSRLIRKLLCSSDTLAWPTCSPAATGLVHQFPGAHAGRILEGGAAGSVARLAGLAFRFDRGHLGGDRVRIAGAALQQRGSEDDILRHAAMTIGKSHLRIAEAAHIALPVDAARLDQNVLGLSPIGAAIHAQRAADGAGNAAEEGEARDAGLLGRARHHDVEHRGAGGDAMIVFDADFVEAAARAAPPRPVRRRRARSDWNRRRSR